MPKQNINAVLGLKPNSIELWHSDHGQVLVVTCQLCGKEIARIYDSDFDLIDVYSYTLYKEAVMERIRLKVLQHSCFAVEVNPSDSLCNSYKIRCIRMRRKRNG